MILFIVLFIFKQKLNLNYWISRWSYSLKTGTDALNPVSDICLCLTKLFQLSEPDICPWLLLKPLRRSNYLLVLLF